MQARPASLPPTGVLFDAPLGDRIEDLLAYSLLYALEGKDRIRVAALSVSKSNLQAAQFCESLARFFMGGSPFLRLPVGLTDDRYSAGPSSMFEPVLSAKDEEDKPRWPYSIRKFTDTADNVPLLRNALTAFHDGNAVVVCTGRATNLARMLSLQGAKEIIQAKARLLVLTDAAGQDSDALAKVKAEWPTPMVCAGDSLNQHLKISLAEFTAKMTWTEHHPVVEAWKAAGPQAATASGAAMAAIHYAANPSGEEITVADFGGKVRSLQVKPEAAPQLLASWLELISFKPEPRRRFRPPVVVDKPPEKPKLPTGPA